uniref:LysR substrate-binding domain-containing protein n=1 Tax=Roseovarius sp. BRH_c41 TaxID=1629709 RepID=UPI000A42CF5C|nr:LysR substrate-binding domain-containing protein [Roseovarius sp. BRH_c41]
MLEALDQSLVRARQAAGDTRGILRVGATPSMISPLVAPVIAQFRSDHPEVKLTLHDDIAETLTDMVADGRLDLALAGRARSSPDLEQTEIASDSIGPPCPAGHRHTRQTTWFHLAEIDPTELIHLDPGTGTARLIVEAPDLPAALKTGGLHCHSTIAQLCLVRAGTGIALLPENAVRLFNDPGIAFLPITDLSLRRRFYLLRSRRRSLTATARRFEQLVLAGLDLCRLDQNETNCP